MKLTRRHFCGGALTLIGATLLPIWPDRPLLVEPIVEELPPVCIRLYLAPHGGVIWNDHLGSKGVMIVADGEGRPEAMRITERTPSGLSCITMSGPGVARELRWHGIEVIPFKVRAMTIDITDAAAARKARLPTSITAHY